MLFTTWMTWLGPTSPIGVGRVHAREGLRVEVHEWACQRRARRAAGDCAAGRAADRGRRRPRARATPGRGCGRSGTSLMGSPGSQGGAGGRSRRSTSMDKGRTARLTRARSCPRLRPRPEPRSRSGPGRRGQPSYWTVKARSSWSSKPPKAAGRRPPLVPEVRANRLQRARGQRVGHRQRVQPGRGRGHGADVGPGRAGSRWRCSTGRGESPASEPAEPRAPHRHVHAHRLARRHLGARRGCCTRMRSMDSRSWNTPQVPSAQESAMVLGWLGSGPPGIVSRPTSSARRVARAAGRQAGRRLQGRVEDRACWRARRCRRNRT